MITAAAFTFILAMFVSGYSDFSNIPVFVCCATLCAFISVSDKKTVRQNIFSVLICLMIFGFAMTEYSFFLKRITVSADKFLSESRETVTGTVINDISSYSDSSDFFIKTEDGNIIKVKLKSLCEIYPGDIVKIENAHIYKVPPENKMKNFNRRLLGKNCVLYLKTETKNFSVVGFSKKYSIISGAYMLKKGTFYELLKYLNYDEAGTAYAMFTSDKEFLPQDITDSLIKTGTIHIATVSGLHFALIAGILITFLRLFIPSYKKRVIITLFFMTAFAFYTGLGVSVIRAYVSLSTIYIADLIGEKRMKLKDIVLLTMSAFLIISPMYVYDISFILTFCATIGIAFFCAPVQKICVKKYGDKISAAVSNIIVTLVMLPFIFAIFGRVSVISIVTNSLVEFVTGALLILVIFTSVFSKVFFPIAHVCAFFLKILIRYFLFVIRIFSKIENISPQIPFYMLCAVFFIICVSAAIYLLIKRDKKVRIKAAAVLTLGIICFFGCYVPPMCENRACITFLGYDSCESVIISKNAHHVVIGSPADLYYYASSSALRENEAVDLWIMTKKTDKKLTDKIRKNYKIKEIIASESISDGEKADYINYYSEDELIRSVKGMNISIKFDYDRLIYTKIEYGKEKLYISDSGDFMDEYLEKLNGCSVLLNTSESKPYKEFLEYVGVPDTVMLYSENDYDLKYHKLSPYAIGMISKENLKFN